MEKLVLVSEGVFPVTQDSKGNRIDEMPHTGMDIPGTIQGEGKLAGTPSLFIRLASCNLRCIWQMNDGSYCMCDTSYASFHPDDKKTIAIEEIVSIVRNNLGEMNHVVITGGEPLLQKNGVADLCNRLKQSLDVHITIETNGTLFDEELARNVDLFSISPKLSNSVPDEGKLKFYNEQKSAAAQYHNETRRNISALQQYVDFCNKYSKELQFKFVVGKKSDEIEIKEDYLNKLTNYRKSDVMLMPLGANMNEIHASAPLVLEMCVKNGWKYTPRVHIELFGSKKGV